MTPPDFSVPDQFVWYESVALSYAKAIRKSRVKRVIYLSSYGAHLSSGTGFITGSHRAGKIWDTLQDVSVAHVRPTSFYYNLFSLVNMIKAAGFMGTVYGGDYNVKSIQPQTRSFNIRPRNI